jgi:tetratricopeptide (TPR) repeat protein
MCAALVRAQEKPSTSAIAPPASPSTQSTDSPFAQARKLLQQGKTDEAIAQLQQLANQQPSLRGLSHELGVAYYKNGDYMKAVESFKAAIAEDANDDEGVQLLGLSYYLAGHPGEAIPYLEKVQAWYPRANVDASYILGLCYIQSKDYSQAKKAFARMFDVPAESAPAYLFTARMLLRQEFVPIAEVYAHKAAELDPKLPLVHYLLGELYLFKSQIPDAISELQKELALNPAYAPVYYKLGDAYSRVQKFDDAERVLQRSIWLDSTSTGPYILMGKVLEKKGETELAVRALQRAAAMDPNNAMTHHLLGQTYREMGKTADADRELHEAERLREAQDAKE